jgi:CheY-like chemotaxis protein
MIPRIIPYVYSQGREYVCTMVEKSHSVLIADDYEADRFFLKEAIRRNAPRLQVIAEVEDGAEVVNYLSGNGKFADREIYPMPEVLIMDMRMPRITGLEVLEWLQKQNMPPLKIAVLADSSSGVFEPKVRALGVKHFFSKVANPSELIHLVKLLQDELESGDQGY